jgi:heme-degrading monooxygenase HmoA
MIAVIFEVEIAEGREAAYLDQAAALRPLLDQQPGFVSVERFRSLSEPTKLLSLSYFANEAAVANWRNLPRHRAAQAAGREGVFAGYRMRVAEVIRDYSMTQRDAAPDETLAHRKTHR